MTLPHIISQDIHQQIFTSRYSPVALCSTVKMQYKNAYVDLIVARGIMGETENRPLSRFPVSFLGVFFAVMMVVVRFF